MWTPLSSERQRLASVLWVLKALVLMYSPGAWDGAASRTSQQLQAHPPPDVDSRTVA